MSKRIRKTKSKQENVLPKIIKLDENRENEDSINWLKHLEPKSSEELLVHVKKLEDIRKWFELTKQTPNKILLLIGPPGCCKLTTIKLLAKSEYNYDIAEWTAKQEVDRNLLVDDGDFSNNCKSQSDAFQEFLFKTSRYRSLFSKKDRLLLVKDFPNIFLRRGNEDIFWKILKKFKAVSSSPLVFILTETSSKSLNIEYNLFPETIRCQLGIETINMNPIAMTTMKKALKKISGIMKEHESKNNEYKEPSQSVIDDICSQSEGDIRNAILNLQIMCQKGSLDIIKNESKQKKTAKTTTKTEKPKRIGMDENIGILHGVGRALFPKRKDTEENKNSKLVHSPEFLADCFSSQPTNYIELLHSNYLKNFSTIDDVSNFTDFMSCSDTFQTEYRNAEKLHTLGLNLVIRAAMVCNTQTPKGFRLISCYASKKFRNTEEKCLQEYISNSKKYNDGHRISLKDYFLDYTSFVKALVSFN